MMTSQQVCELAAAGMEVGAHTVTHPILRVLPREAAATEIDDSRRVVASITGRPVRAFAYPNGQLNDDYTLRDRDLVSAHGFEVAVSTNGGVATASCDRFQLPRFTPWDRRPERWLARLLMAYRRGA
jgi:peptidoglycan/xylan/chitin deacetylase (PgdA/CDA1 family)